MPAAHRYLLFALCFLLIFVFASVIEADYLLFDEDIVILNNPMIRAPLTIGALKNIFTSFETNQYTPLSVLSFWFEYNVFGFNSAVSHLINLLLHIACAMVVYFLAFFITKNMLTSWLIAALWSVHPVQVETVAWVLERRNLLHALFYFAASVAYLRYLQTERRRDMAFALFLMLLSGLSKTLAFLLPFTWFLLDWLKERPFSWKLVTEKIAAFLLAGFLLFTTLYAAHGEIRVSETGGLNWKTAGSSIVFYVAKTLVPLNLSATYEINPFSSGKLVCSSLCFFLFVMMAILVSVRSRLAAVAVMFYLLHILPMSGLVKVGYDFYAALHFMYIPLLGLVMAAVAVVKRLTALDSSDRLPIFASLLVVLLLATFSRNYCLVWNNSGSLFEHSLALDPANKFARHQLARFLETKKLWAEAVGHYRELTVIYPDFFGGYYGLGRIFMLQNKLGESIVMFNEAMKYNLERWDIPLDRGCLLLLMKKYRAAENDFSESLAYEETQKARFLRSDACRRQGDYSGAINDLAFLLEADSENFAAKLGLFEVFVESGRWLSALEVMVSVLSQMADNHEKWNYYMAMLSSPGLSVMFGRMIPYRSLVRYRLNWHSF